MLKKIISILCRKEILTKESYQMSGWHLADILSSMKELLSELKIVLPYVLDNNDKVISYKAIYDRGNHMTELILEKST